MSTTIETRLIKRNTRAKNMYCYISKMQDTAKELGLIAEIYPTNFSNWIILVEVDIQVIITGETKQIDLFDILIDKRDAIWGST